MLTKSLNTCWYALVFENKHKCFVYPKNLKYLRYWNGYQVNETIFTIMGFVLDPWWVLASWFVPWQHPCYRLLPAILIRYRQLSPGSRSGGQHLVRFYSCTGPSPSFSSNWKSLLPSFLYLRCWGKLCSVCISSLLPTNNCMPPRSILQTN